MSKRERAPGDLELVRAFVNTVDLDPGTEQLDTGAALSKWLADQGLTTPGVRATSADLARATALREALRAILIAHTDGSAPPAAAARVVDEAARRARVRLRFTDVAASVLEPEAGGVDGGLGRLVAIIHEAIRQGTWSRLKACREHTCEWAFFDHTKNRSGAWCNMQVCGNRAKARAYRKRRSTPGDT